MTNFNWNATAFFERLTASNKLAQQEHFAFLRVSGLEGLEEALHTLQRQTAFVLHLYASCLGQHDCPTAMHGHDAGAFPAVHVGAHPGEGTGRT